MEHQLWESLEAGRRSVMIVSHSFELLGRDRTRPDPIAVRRFEALCRFLDRHRDQFRARGFGDLQPAAEVPQPLPLRMPIWPTARRLAEQGLRRLVAGEPGSAAAPSHSATRTRPPTTPPRRHAGTAAPRIHPPSTPFSARFRPLRTRA